MERIIALTMEPSKDIVVSIDGEERIRIKKDDRSIKANELYSLLNYNKGDKYKVESFNPDELDKSAFKYFTDLLFDICNRINDISDFDETDDEGELTEDEEADVNLSF